MSREMIDFLEKKPNIVLVVADDYGFNDVGYHGSEIKTPNLDRISASGLRLENYYVQPICTPSRSQLMSGRYQIHTGLQHQLIWRGMPSGLPSDTQLMPEALRACGYDTFAVGKWHLGYSKSSQTPWGRGFNKFTGYLGGSEDYYKKRACNNVGVGKNKDCGVDYTTEDKKGNRIYSNQTFGRYSAFDYVSKANLYIESHLENDPTNPFMLYLPLQSVHMPLEAPENYIKPYRKTAASKQRAVYSGMDAVLDEAVGNITRSLKENNLWKNTLFIFSTDNGGQAYAGGSNLPFRGNKGGYWEGGIKGVGFVAGGSLKAKTKKYKNLIHISDWFPTILDAAKCQKNEKSPELDGYSHWNSFVNPGPDMYVPRQEILHNIDPLSNTDGTDERTFNSDYDITKQSAIRWRNYKLLTGDPGYPDYPIPIPPNETLSDLFTHVITSPELDLSRIPVRPTPLTKLLQLYDIQADPLEQNEISDQNMEIVDFILAQLKDFNKTQVPGNLSKNRTVVYGP